MDNTVNVEFPIITSSLKVVATLTTLPSNYESLINSVKSIQAQDYPVDAIYLTVPKKANRLNKEYPPLPEELLKACTVVKIDVDYGPVTKLYGALISEKDPNTVIISCDDDVIYHPTMIRTMIEHHNKYRNMAICGTGALVGKGILLCSIVYPSSDWKFLPVGFDVGKDGRNVDIVYGVTGVLYLRKFFPSNSELYSEFFKYALENESVFLNDDVLISGYLSQQNIKRRVFNDIPDVVHQLMDGTSALSHDFIKQLISIDRSIKYLKDNGLFPTMEPLAVDETIIGRTIIITILVIAMIVLSVFMHKGT